MVTPSSRSFGQHVEQFVDHRRREAQRRLVEQQDARLRHQAARDGEHLLLAAGEQPGAARQPFAQAREALQQRLDLGFAIDIPPRVCAEHDVVAHGQFGKHLAAFRHQRDAARGDPMRGQLLDPLVVEHDRARHRPQQAGHRAHRRRLAGAVGAEQRHHLAGLHRERHLFEHRRRAIAGAELETRQDRIAASRSRPRRAAAPAFRRRRDRP